MGLNTARLGDFCDHGAIILSGVSSRHVDGRPVATLGDLVNCPFHGLNTIASVSNTPQSGGKPTAYVSAVAACGATIITGSEDAVIDAS